MHTRFLKPVLKFEISLLCVINVQAGSVCINIDEHDYNAVIPCTMSIALTQLNPNKCLLMSNGRESDTRSS